MLPPELVSVAREGVITYEYLRNIPRMEVSPSTLIDELALEVASKYSDSKMTFEEADKIMNAAFSVSVTEEFWAESDRVIPPLMYEVYEAFDAGEYFHHDDPPEVDPEIKYTKPLIAKFLSVNTILQENFVESVSTQVRVNPSTLKITNSHQS